MWTSWLVLSATVFTVLQISSGQNVTDGAKQNKNWIKNVACVEGCKRAHWRVAKRFSDYKLDNLCDSMNNWYQQLLKSRTPRKYTQRQSDFLIGVQRCRSAEECFEKQSKGKHETMAPSPAIRKECRTLTTSEFQQLTNGLNKLKEDKIEGVSKYDLLISYHNPHVSPEAHFGPAFLPFHREYLKQLEVALRRLNPNSAVCYWDSNLDQGLPKPEDSVLWTSELFGNGNGIVTEGPFANWTVMDSFPGTNDSFIHRYVGESDTWELYTEDDFDFIMSKTTYQDFGSYCIEPTFTMLHNSVHEFVGGHMTYTATSPNDPVFFLHHSFVDCLWETWRLAKQTAEERETDYPTNGPKACCSQHYADAPMRPFPMLNKDALNNSYATLFKYAPLPTCKAGCTGPFLFCDTDRDRCLSKVRLRGNCTGLEKFDACYKSKCVRGVCSTDIGQSVIVSTGPSATMTSNFPSNTSVISTNTPNTTYFTSTRAAEIFANPFIRDDMKVTPFSINVANHDTDSTDATVVCDSQR